MKPLGDVVIKQGREKRLRNHYPWVQKSEILRVDAAGDGSPVVVLDHKREPIGVGTYNANHRFPLRIFDTKVVDLDTAWFRERFRQAEELRAPLRPRTDARRSLYSEGDRVPGLIADTFGDHCVAQVRSLGIERLKDQWLPALVETLKPKSVLEKSDMASRKDEGLPATVQTLHGTPPDSVQITEDGVLYNVPMTGGLKTGHYLDQRETKRQFAHAVRPDDKVLDCFSYTGGFSLIAKKAGASVVGVDINTLAIEAARANASLNGLDVQFIEANAFEFLEAGADNHGPFDWIVLDPPAIAKSRGKRDSLKWAVWNLVYHALPLLKPNGTLIVCTCSFQSGIHETTETCRLASNDRGVRLALDKITLQDIDHPAPVQFPESLYLTCLWLRRLP